MSADIHDDVTLELAYLTRAAMERLHKRAREEQLGEAWIGLAEQSTDDGSISDL